MPLSVSRTRCSGVSGSWSCGRLERSPLGSVLAETWKGSPCSTRWMWRSMLAENCGSTSFSTSWPSYSDHISPTVSSPPRVHPPPAPRLAPGADHDSAQVVHPGVDRAALLFPVLACLRQLQPDGVALAAVV